MLRDYLRPVFDDDTLDKFCKYLGLTISGRAQSYRSVILCLGGEGTGKGGTCKLVERSLGGRAASIGSRLLEKTTSEIDSDRYYLVVRQPLAIIIDEMGVAASRANVYRLLTLTGDIPLPRCRMPFGVHSVSDTIPSVLWMPTVLVPAIGRGTGIERRLLVIPFRHKIADADKLARASYPQELLDAVITVAVREAQAVYQSGYEPPTDDAETRRKALEEMDPLMAVIEGLDPFEWDGKLMADLLELLQQGSPELTSTALGLKISAAATGARIGHPAGRTGTRWSCAGRSAGTRSVQGVQGKPTGVLRGIHVGEGHHRTRGSTSF